MTSRTYDTAARRWEGVGPYYAMFPTWFADQTIARYSGVGDCVFDPFAGRGTSVFSAAHQMRRGIGIEINPVGWIYAKVKLAPAPSLQVEDRIREIGQLAPGWRDGAQALPKFFHHCFSAPVREYLCAAREMLDWRQSVTDRTVMALLLIYLHGKSGAALSNQMRQTKAMAPDYAVRWWIERDLSPPELDPVQFLVKRLAWRYAKGLPRVHRSEVHLGDCEEVLPTLRARILRSRRRIKLLLTSPPYFSLTNYHYDQWLRLWLLGGLPDARRVPGTHEKQGKFENESRYRMLLQRVFHDCSALMASDSFVYVRTGADEVTFDATKDALKEAFPRHTFESTSERYTGPTQTRLFGDQAQKSGEIDILMTSI